MIPGPSKALEKTQVGIMLLCMLVVVSVPAWYLHHHVATTEHVESRAAPCEVVPAEKVFVTAPAPHAASAAGGHSAQHAFTRMHDPEFDHINSSSSACPPTDEWCSVPMPAKSFFGFDAPDDPAEWRRAQILASKGGHVLLRRVMRAFPHPNDFLDGDIAFRQLHKTVDVFIDKEHYFEKIATPKDNKPPPARVKEHAALKYGFTDEKDKRVDPWMLRDYTYVPPDYEWKQNGRIPIVQIGYTVFERDHNKYFSGNELGGLYFGRQHFLQRWFDVADRLTTPIILVAGLNENWGFLREVYKFLDHPNLLMLVGSQHSNFSHPKLLTLPRGVPLTWSNTHKILWDTMRQYGFRPAILKCISKKFTVEEFEGHSDTPPHMKRVSKTDRPTYYAKLATSRFGLSLPGLGYDCYRTWEILTMGGVLVLERGIGLDRTFWRLPVLLLKDFSDLNPQMLKQAYVEAMYRRDDFEYERLHMSYWLQVLTDVSATRNIETMMARFPMEAEDPTHTRYMHSRPHPHSH